MNKQVTQGTNRCKPRHSVKDRTRRRIQGLTLEGSGDLDAYGVGRGGRRQDKDSKGPWLVGFLFFSFFFHFFLLW